MVDQERFVKDTVRGGNVPSRMEMYKILLARSKEIQQEANVGQERGDSQETNNE